MRSSKTSVYNNYAVTGVTCSHGRSVQMRDASVCSEERSAMNGTSGNETKYGFMHAQRAFAEMQASLSINFGSHFG